MKETVLDIEEVQRWLPVFNNRIGAALIKEVFRWIDIDKVNRIHSNHCHLRGSAFTSAMLNDPMMDVSYEIHHREILDQLPQGAFITVSNHPIGSLDGIILIDLFASIRPDFRLMVNDLLSHISAMADNFISVLPNSRKDPQAVGSPKNINGIRLALKHIREGSPMGFFPAGAMSFYNKTAKAVRDLPWKHSIIRLIRKANVPVFPVYFDSLNSRFFYLLGCISWKLRHIRIAPEAFNKKGRKLDVYLRNPIDPKTIQNITNDDLLSDFLYKKTYDI